MYMRKDAKAECVLWTEDGVWLQTFDVGGTMRLSGLGRMSLHGVEIFCEERGLAFEVLLRGETLGAGGAGGRGQRMAGRGA